MLKKLQMIVVLMAISMVSFAQINEDFESYNAGEKLVTQAVAQGLDYWTTWSGTPGSAEDPTVSSDFGSKHVVIEGTNDAVLLLGNKTAGVFNLEFDAYIPTGKFGYFNVLQAFAGANSEWGMQAFLDANGVGRVDAGGEGAGSFTYSYDTWFPVKMNIDLEADLAELWVNGTSVITWVWSGGTFGTGTLNQIAAMNAFAWADNGAPGAHFDNISFEPVSSVEIFDNLEAYNAGGKLVQQALAQGITYWTCWSGDGGAGGAEDPVISTDQANSGSKSFMIDGTNDVVIKLGDKTAGKYSYDFYMYVPTGFVGYYNMLQNWNPGGSAATWGLEVYFDPGGSGKVNAANTTPLATFSYPYDSWIHVENIINLNTDNAAVKINGVEVVSWEWSIGASGGGVNKLAAADFYAAATNGTPKFYVDDVTLTELEPAVGPAQITVSPASFTFDLESGSSTTKTLVIGNDGIAKLVWAAYPSYAMGKSANYTPVDYSNISIPEVAVVEGKAIANNAGTDDMVTLHYDGENASAVGLTNGGSFEIGARFPVSMTNNYIGMAIYEVQVFVNEAVTASSIKIYGHGTEEQSGEVLYEQAFAATIGWNNVGLNTPIDITGGDIWVSLALSHDAGLFPAGCDAGPAVTNGDWFKSGAAWVPMHIANPTLNANWNIRAIAEGTPSAGFITLNPASGQITTGNTTNVTATFNATNLNPGTYNANIVINSNDPVTPQKLVPVTLNVTGETPALDPPTDLQYQIVNNKDVKLTWVSPLGAGFDPVWLTYSGNTITNSIGTNSAANFDVAARYEPSGLSGFDNGAVTRINFVPGEPDNLCTYTLKVWQGSGNPTLIYSQVLTSVTADVWNEVVLTTPVPFNKNQELWFGFNCNTTGGFPGGCDDGPQVEGKGNMMFWEGAWTTLTALSPTLTFNWAVKAYIEPAGLDAVLVPVIQPIVPVTSGKATFGLNPERMVPAAVFTPDAGSRGLTGYKVYRNGSVIASNITATQYTDVNLNAGTYTYCVTAVYTDGESDCSNDVEVVIVGIDNPANATFNIYPNPANEVVNINSAVTVKSVKLMNYTGQIVYSNHSAATQFSINTSDIAAGVYMLQLETENGISTSKLIIK